MKKFLLSLATAFSFVLFLGSCTNEEDINNNGYSDKEKAKIETLMNLFDSYVALGFGRILGRIAAPGQRERRGEADQ